MTSNFHKAKLKLALQLFNQCWRDHSISVAWSSWPHRWSDLMLLFVKRKRWLIFLLVLLNFMIGKLGLFTCKQYGPVLEEDFEDVMNTNLVLVLIVLIKNKYKWPKASEIILIMLLSRLRYVVYFICSTMLLDTLFFASTIHFLCLLIPFLCLLLL